MIDVGKTAFFAMLIGLAVPVSANELGVCNLRDWTVSKNVEDKRKALYEAYSDCSQTANERELSRSEAKACTELYTRLKLTFLPGSSYERFQHLSAATRAYGNEQAYAAYRAWLHRNTVSVSAQAASTAAE